MRTRVLQDSTASSTWPVDWIVLNNSFYNDRSVVSHLTSARSTVMVDVVTPEFSKLQNQGVIINNPMWFEDLHYQYSPIVVFAEWLKSDGSYGTSLKPYFTPLEIPDALPTLPNITLLENFFDQYSNYGDLAVNRAWSNVELSEAMILASLGEFPETLKWFKSVYERAVNLTKLLRSKSRLLREIPSVAKSIMAKDTKALKKLAAPAVKGSKKSDLASEFANAWLEYRYAIRPLIYEIKGVLEALKKIVNKGTRQTARGKEVNLSKISTVDSWSKTSDYSGSQSATYRRVVSSTLTCRAGVLFQIEDDLDALLAIWGIDQPLESVWELIPFSFIIDWFFSIGDTISAWSVNPSLTPLSSWVTYNFAVNESRTSLSFDIVNKNGYSWSTPQITHGSAGLSYIRKWRKPSPCRSILPRFDLKLDLAKIIDLGTIGRSLLSGKRPYQKGA